MVSVDDEYLLKEFSVSCRSLRQLSLMNRNSFRQSLALEKSADSNKRKFDSFAFFKLDILTKVQGHC